MSPPAIRLPRNRLNALLWAKQGFGSKKGRPVVETVEGNFGLYGTAPTCYLSLLARIPGFRLEDLDRETVTNRRLVRLRAMRVSPFLVSVADLPMTYQATKNLRQSDFGPLLGKLGVTRDLYLRTADRIEELLAEAPKTASELKKEIRPDSEALQQGFNYVIAQMCHEGRLVRGQARGGWRSDRFEYARLADWLPGVDLREIRPGEARCRLALRYFEAWGPATAEDFRWWSGFGKRQAAEALAALGDDLVQVDVMGVRDPCYALARERAALESRSAPSAQGLALVPVWDAYLMAYASRGRFLDRQWTDKIYDPSGNATSAVLWKGRVVGVWDLEELDRRLRVKVAPFVQLPWAAWKELRREVERIARAIGKREVIVERCPAPRPLSEGPRNAFLSPLKGVSGTPV